MNKSSTPQRDWDIYNRHCNGETLAAIAADYSISRERVRQICYEQNALNRQKFIDSVSYDKPRETELYKWIMLREYSKPCDSSIRARAYNAMRLAWNKAHDHKGNPTVEYLLSFDNSSIRNLRGVGTTTAMFLVNVRDAIIEERKKRDETEIAKTGRYTYIGADGNVYLRSTVKLEDAAARLYAFENTKMGPIEAMRCRHTLCSQMGKNVEIRPIELQELPGIMPYEAAFIEYRNEPRQNGYIVWKNLTETMSFNKIEIEDYMIWWRLWPVEPSPEIMATAEWKERADARIGA